MDMPIKEKFLVFEVKKSLTKDNKPYYRFTFSAIDGSKKNGILFDVSKIKYVSSDSSLSPEEKEELKNREPESGQVFLVNGVSQVYNNTQQIKISDMELVTDLTEEEKKAFYPTSGQDADVMAEEIINVLYANIKTPHLRALVDEFLNDADNFKKFMNSSAAKTIHHAYVHGLLEHTLSMVKLAVLICDFYKNIPYGQDINKELVILGCLFHDFGKILEIDPNIDKAFEYTEEGKLIGHLIIGIQIVSGYMAKIPNFPEQSKNLIIHLIAAHNGKIEYGSPVMPKIKEAILVNYIDNLDAKMNTINGIFKKEEVPVGGWSGFDRILESQFFNHGLKPEE